MRMIDPFIMELDRECATTRKLLERVPDGKLDWAPHPKSSTLGRLAMHVATLPEFAKALLGDGFDAAAAPLDPARSVPERASGIVERFDKVVVEAKAALAQLDDARAMGAWRLSFGPKTLFTMPRIAVVRNFILNHVIHHRGQLSVYLRLLDVPLPPIYGPTADENPFA
ncbi:MAG: DinB family protein [Thermoanaerobaculia bacterium]|nr:DinB family protein [Thermoanaerobaculia bacterium]